MNKDVSNKVSNLEKDSNPSALAPLMLGAVGVVYGDIGTSPLYTMKLIFSNSMSLDANNVLGILSLIFWSLTIVVTIKYVMVIMRADNRGQGGVLALSTLAQRGLNPKLAAWVAVMGMLGLALFIGDSLITPAISVLSAMEGIKVVAPTLDHWIVPATLVVLAALFIIQNKGTDTVGKLFGPIMITWFGLLGGLGLAQIIEHPAILLALNPLYAVQFFSNHGWSSFFVLGFVVLAVTGGEALYADMGHFGCNAIRWTWLFFVLPCLVLNYFGQGALLISTPSALENPFYLLAPQWLSLPMLALATCATVIASQAVISGAFSLTQQAIQLGYLPRREIRHTSSHAIGQVYIPRTNWLLLAGVVLLVIGFRTSDNLASAYGISVVGAMTIDAILASLVAARLWHWPLLVIVPLFGLFIAVDLVFLAANLVKIPEGGWFPITIAMASFGTMCVWRKGRRMLAGILYGDAMPLKDFIKGRTKNNNARTPGTAIFLTGDPTVVPVTMLHNLKHNKVMHDRVLVMKVQIEDVPYKRPENRATVESLGDGFYTAILHFGFMEKPDVPQALKALEQFGIEIDMMKTSFFIGRETLLADRTRQGLNPIEEQLFIALSKTASSATQFFGLPPNAVVELGSQVVI